MSIRAGAYGSNWQLDESFLKCKSSAVAPRDSIYKQKYVAFFSILCNIIFDKRETSHHKKNQWSRVWRATTVALFISKM